MHLTLRQLQIFSAVAQTGSTAAGAEAVSLSQSAASAALNELEALLDTQLFDRVGKRLLLNENGRLLLPQARQLLDAAIAMEQQFTNTEAVGGLSLHIGASTTIGIYVLPHVLTALGAGRVGAARPRVMIANTARIAAAVADFELDAGFIEGPCHQPELQVERWIADDLVIVASPQHPILDGHPQREISLSLLRAAEWLLRETGSGTREAVEHALTPYLHHLRPAGELSNSEAIKHAVAAGLGITCLSRSVVADFLATGRLVELRTPLPPLMRHFSLIYNRRKFLSVRLQGLLEVCRQFALATPEAANLQ